MGRISKKLAKKFSKKNLSKIVNLQEVNEAKKRLNEIGDELDKKFAPVDLDPSHQTYLFMQNILSYFAEEVSVLDEFEEYYDVLVEIEDMYMPSYPPMSPLTSSYYTLWAFLDFKFGKDKETIGTIFYDLINEQNMDELTLLSLANLNKSCMRFYKHEGLEDDLVLLKDIITGETHTCLSTSKYLGTKNEIWYARLLPNLDGVYDYKIVMTTPYVVINYTERDWLAFFERQGIQAKDIQAENKYIDFMKYNKDHKYWHEYIMDGYSNYTYNCIFLTGIPDLAGTKPHECTF